MIRFIRRSILFFILVAAILAVGWFHFKTESIFRHVEAIVHAMEEGVHEGKAAPTFALPTLSGGIGEFNPKKGHIGIQWSTFLRHGVIRAKRKCR